MVLVTVVMGKERTDIDYFPCRLNMLKDCMPAEESKVQGGSKEKADQPMTLF